MVFRSTAAALALGLSLAGCSSVPHFDVPDNTPDSAKVRVVPFGVQVLVLEGRKLREPLRSGQPFAVGPGRRWALLGLDTAGLRELPTPAHVGNPRVEWTAGGGELIYLCAGIDSGRSVFNPFVLPWTQERRPSESECAERRD